MTDVEQKDVQTGAYFTEPTEKTRKIHEKLIQMCMADIDNKTRKFAANNPQVTLQEGIFKKMLITGGGYKVQPGPYRPYKWPYTFLVSYNRPSISSRPILNPLSSFIGFEILIYSPRFLVLK